MVHRYKIPFVCNYYHFVAMNLIEQMDVLITGFSRTVFLDLAHSYIFPKERDHVNFDEGIQCCISSIFTTMNVIGITQEDSGEVLSWFQISFWVMLWADNVYIYFFF